MVSKNYNFLLACCAVIVAITTACSKGSSNKTSSVVPSATTTTGGTTGVAERKCRIAVENTSKAGLKAALEAIAQARVNRKETPVTVCMAAESTPLKKFDASFRVEYEDNNGLRWVTFRKQDLVYSIQSGNKFRVIYLDQYGYVELNTTLKTVNGIEKYSGSIRVANTGTDTSFLDSIEEFLKDIEKQCKKSPVKCFDPIFVTDPYQQAAAPTEAQILQKAEDAFAGKHGATAFTLGTVEFSPDFIERTLF